jgi:glycine/betaine/sarcosine/D-proline reductase family selenoprotein B
LEKAGIPVCQVTSVVPIAKMVGSNRIVQGTGIVHPLGAAELPPDEEKELRRKTVLQALEALKSEAPGR